MSKTTLFQPGLNLGGLSEGEHLAALARFELFPFRHGFAMPLSTFHGDSFKACSHAQVKATAFTIYCSSISPPLLIFSHYCT